MPFSMEKIYQEKYLRIKFKDNLSRKIFKNQIQRYQYVNNGFSKAYKSLS
jgi:hypothetical protein